MMMRASATDSTGAAVTIDAQEASMDASRQALLAQCKERGLQPPEWIKHSMADFGAPE